MFVDLCSPLQELHVDVFVFEFWKILKKNVEARALFIFFFMKKMKIFSYASTIQQGCVDHTAVLRRP
jgi:hypothetical protein